MKSENWGRSPLIEDQRLISNLATERYQPYHGYGVLNEIPIEQHGAVGVITTISRGPLGVGATFRFAEPMSDGWHHVQSAEPILTRPAGA